MKKSNGGREGKKVERKVREKWQGIEEQGTNRGEEWREDSEVKRNGEERRKENHGIEEKGKEEEASREEEMRKERQGK